jgi:hypothetical protein
MVGHMAFAFMKALDVNHGSQSSVSPRALSLGSSSTNIFLRHVASSLISSVLNSGSLRNRIE